MATARLRKTFRYPSDDEASEQSHDEMDEEEQENLLSKLRATESSTNAQYILVFTALPLLITMPFLWYLTAVPTRPAALLCILSITSLLSSAYSMYLIPISKSPPDAQSIAARSRPPRHRDSGPLSGAMLAEPSPIHRYLPYLSGGIGVLLFLAALSYRSRADVPEGLWLFLLLPGIVVVMVVLAKRSMAQIQMELGELQKLRYNYKGA